MTRSPKSLKETYRQLHPLTAAGYVDHIYTGPPRWGGKPMRAYFLADRAFRHLRDLGLIAHQGYRARAVRSRSQLHFSHTVESNDLAILCMRLSKVLPHIAVARLMTEHELKRQPVYVDLPKGTRQAVIPDGFVSLRTPEERNFVFELDRNTEWLKKPIVRKVAAYLKWEKGPYMHAFNTEVLTAICWVVTRGGEHRAELLRQITEQVLKEAKAEDMAEVFRFAAVNPAAVDPPNFFLSPVWLKPFATTPLSLLGSPPHE